MQKKCWLFLCVLLISCWDFSYAQDKYDHLIDSYFQQIEDLIKRKSKYEYIFLNQELLISKSKEVSGKDKVLVFLDLYEATKFKSINSAYRYNEDALELALKLDFHEGVYKAEYNRAYLNFVHGDFVECINKIEELESKVSFDFILSVYADVKTLKSYVYTERGEYDLALEIAFDLLEKAESLKEDYLFLRAYSSLSHYYLRKGQYSTALDYCLKNFGFILKLKKTQYIYPKIDEIARMKAKLDFPYDALEIYKFGLKVEKEIPSTGSFLQSSVFLNMATVYMQINDYISAQEYLTKALQINYENNYNFRIPRALTLQAELHLALKDTLEAIKFYEKSVFEAEEINAFDVIKTNSLIISKLYTEKQKLSKAYEYQKLYEAIRDSLFTNENEQKILILETKREVSEITQMKKVLELENEVQKNRYHFILVVLLLLTIIFIVILFLYFEVRGKNRMLFQRTVELASLTSEIKRRDDGATTIIKNEISTVEKKSQGNQLVDSDTKKIILYRLYKWEEENLFLDPGCSLIELATKLKTNTKYLSQIINQEKQTNFSNYINDLRINYLTTRLWEDQEFRSSKISFIAASVGFNNINTFKTAFKKRHGILPSFFISELNKKLS